MDPDRSGGLRYDGGVEADLLVRGRPVVVVGEDDPQAAVHARHVDDRVEEPPLDRRPRAVVLVDETAVAVRNRFPAPEEGMGPRHERRILCATGAVRGVSVAGRVERVDRVDPLLDHPGREGPVLVVPPVARPVGRGEVPLRQVDVLADDVGGGLHLVVVHFEELRHQVGVEKIGAVERVVPDDEGLRRLDLVDRIEYVLPQGGDPLLRVVVPHLVEDGVDLDGGALVEPGVVGGELRGTGDAEPLRGAVEELARTGTGSEKLPLVVDARLEERRAGDGRGPVDAEARVPCSRCPVGSVRVDVHR